MNTGAPSIHRDLKSCVLATSVGLGFCAVMATSVNVDRPPGARPQCASHDALGCPPGAMLKTSIPLSPVQKKKRKRA